MRSVCLLGASGNIGEQTLDILERERDRFVLLAIAVGNRYQCVERIVESFPTITHIYCKNPADKEKLLQNPVLSSRKLYCGEGQMEQMIRDCGAELVVNALVGFAGLLPSIASLQENKILCLANKESLVVGGRFINKLLDEGHGILYPIDSEHAAVHKMLSVCPLEKVDKICITASGGAFRDKSLDELSEVTPEDALAHPTWNMGAKITIDSATMMNKGFELIEACELFHVPLEKLEVLMHRESYIHSALRLKDGSYLCDISKPDMRGPIAYALHEATVKEPLTHVNSLDELKDFHFWQFDAKRYPCVEIALWSHRRGGNSNAILNAANEVAVNSFLQKRISLLQIEDELRYAFKSVPFIADPTLEEVIETDRKTREIVISHIERR